MSFLGSTGRRRVSPQAAHLARNPAYTGAAFTFIQAEEGFAEMLGLITIASSGDDDSSCPVELASASRRKRIWLWFVEWLTEPISFPGKWPVPPSAGLEYNESDELNSGADSAIECDVA